MITGAGLAMTDESDEFLPTKRTLLNRLKDWGDQQSWQEFFDLYSRLIHSVALKAGLTRTEAEEVVQETILTVAKKIGEFRSDPALGSFKGWLMVITRRRIADQFEKRARAGRLAAALPPAQDVAPSASSAEDGTRTSTLLRVPDPASLNLEAHWEEQWQKHLLNAATARVKAQVSPKQFQAFELYVRREWPVTKVARTLGMSAASVYLAKHRVGSLLKKELKKLERDVV
jgi:RNA polymerase sigma factor (sigma-70 family)